MKISGLFKKWNQYLNELSNENKDIYFTEEYVKLYETKKKEAICFVYVEDDSVFLLPFLKEKIFQTEYFDFETSYGYSGPVTNNYEERFLSKAWLEFENILKSNNFIAGFIRLHPILENYKITEKYIETYNDRKTISIDLSQSEEDIWHNQIHSKHRNVIRKAVSEGLIYEVDDSYRYLDEFYNLYNLTMKRINANPFYYFKKEYYEKIVKNLKEKSFLGVVKSDNKIIAMAIFLYSEYYGHYHLAGSLEKYLKYYPNNFMIYKTALEMKKRALLNFHLGGGLSSSLDDPLYKFKKRFSKTEKDFKIAKIITNENVYQDLCNKWECMNPQKAELYGNITLRYRL